MRILSVTTSYRNKFLGVSSLGYLLWPVFEVVNSTAIATLATASLSGFVAAGYAKGLALASEANCSLGDQVPVPWCDKQPANPGVFVLAMAPTGPNAREAQCSRK